MPTSCKSVAVELLKPGDKFLLYSSRRHAPRTVKVQSILKVQGEAQIKTPQGLVKLPLTATVDVP